MREAENKLNGTSSNASEASQSMMQSVESRENIGRVKKSFGKVFEQLVSDLKPNLAQRLTKLEKTEKKLSTKLVSIMPSSVGKLPSQRY